MRLPAVGRADGEGHNINEITGSAALWGESFPKFLNTFS
jgi:hypothetical protein